ncbi:MAG: TIM-barrel domain-containing protein, partial [Terracidiphilus sp.]
LGGTRGAKTANFGLITLPSGVRRWERRALLHRATPSELEAIRRLQQQLGIEPTSAANLAERVRLAEIWYGLFDQEGLSFHPESGTWILGPGELDPWTARHRFNDALAAGDVSAACRILDSLLKHFNRISQSWFADGSPGDANEKDWIPVDALESVSDASGEIVLQARTGKKEFPLSISFPSTGGVRLHGPGTGFFAPASSLVFKLAKTPDGVRATEKNLAVAIRLHGIWRIDLFANGNPRAFWSVARGDLRVRQNAVGQIEAVDLRGGLEPGEGIFGLGERFDSFNQRGKTLTLWQLDAWDSLYRGGLENQAYKPIPLWHSSTGYSVFWNSSYELRADFGNAQQDRYRVVAHGPIFDLYLWPGDWKDVLVEYTSLTGKPLLPPAWAFEPWMGGGGGRWARDRDKSPAQTMLDVASEFRRLDIPHSAIYAEGQGSSDPLLYRRLDPWQIRVLTWGRSEPLGWTNEQIRRALPDVPAARLPLMRVKDGSVYGFSAGHILANQFPYFDFTDPASFALLRAYWAPHLDLGVAGTMVDFGDLVPRNALFHDGSTGEQMHNWYAHLYHRSMHRLFEERRGDDYVLFARGGAPGSQADVSQMAGDHASNFRGLDESIAGGLSIGVSGFSNWGVDVGGYEGKPDEEVYQRWIEFGAFSPLMRFHGTQPREPWFYSQASVAVYKKYAWLRENLLPYIYGTAQETHATGVPLMRALPALADDEYMFGDDLLVAPVHTPGERRIVSLPDGNWTNLFTGLPASPGKNEQHVPLDAIPVFLRAGALVPIRVAPDFTLGKSMSKGSIPALLVTPPGAQAASHATSHDWKLPGAEAESRLENRLDAAGFRVTIHGWRDLRFLVILGARAPIATVTADGRSLPELDVRQADSSPPGWWQLDGGHIVVRLPECPDHVVIVASRNGP